MSLYLYTFGQISTIKGMLKTQRDDSQASKSYKDVPFLISKQIYGYLFEMDIRDNTTADIDQSAMTL